MHPEDDVLAQFALGEPVDPAVVAHVADCPTCTAAISELRETMSLVGDAAGEDVVTPPASVWEAVRAEVADEAGPTASVTRIVPDELARRRRPAFGWIAVAAAIGVVAGVAGAQVVLSAPWQRPAVLAQAQLDTLDTGARGGEAELLSSKSSGLDLRVQVQPLDPGDGYLEVWLINSDLRRMVSIGVLPKDATVQDFRITDSLIDQGYVIVDISRERFDDRPQHSGDSLLRGSLS